MGHLPDTKNCNRVSLSLSDDNGTHYRVLRAWVLLKKHLCNAATFDV